MAAGLGFKTFTTGEVLTAADVNGYLMQGILVFASEAARNAAITSPQEGQFAFTKDNNSLWYYTGSAWAASGATGDIEGVTAGVGISGGGTSGTVTITNDMATTITASGDIVVGTGSGTYDNLPIGSTGQVLTADTTVSPYKVKWAPVGAASLSWTSYTPTYQNFTLGNGTVDARYIDEGELVFVYIKITLGSTSSVTGTWDFTLPFTSSHSSWLAPCYIQDAGTATYVGWLNSDSVRMALYAGNTGGTYLSYSSSSATVPMTWASGDFIQAYFFYKKA